MVCSKYEVNIPKWIIELVYTSIIHLMEREIDRMELVLRDLDNAGPEDMDYDLFFRYLFRASMEDRFIEAVVTTRSINIKYKLEAWHEHVWNVISKKYIYTKDFEERVTQLYDHIHENDRLILLADYEDENKTIGYFKIVRRWFYIKEYLRKVGVRYQQTLSFSEYLAMDTSMKMMKEVIINEMKKTKILFSVSSDTTHKRTGFHCKQLSKHFDK